MNIQAIVNARFLTQPVTGVQRYSIEICKRIKNMAPGIEFVSPRGVLDHNLARELNAKIIGVNTGHIWEQIDLPIYLKNIGSPLLINLANTSPVFYKNKITTLHDVAFERFPESFSNSFRLAYKILTPISLKHSRKIITVSEFSKREITSIYGTDSQRIQVIPNAASEIFKRKINNNTEKYVLAVSSLSKQKNFSRLIDAFNITNQSTHKLYIVGSFNRNFADPELIEQIENSERIKVLGRVSDEELVVLYSGASAFIYPSLYEGFGIPPLEAQACGCPVILSDAASLPEVGGDSVLYCAPEHTKDIAEKIDLLLSTPQLSEELTFKGYKNFIRYNWENSAKELIKLIKEGQ